MKILLTIFIALLSLSISKAQYVEDAIRMLGSNGQITQRAGALGVSSYGISDDASALYYIPAGIFLQKDNELNFGMNLTNGKIITNYNSTETTNSANSQAISNISLIIPGRNTHTDGLTIGFSYFYDKNLNSTSGFNSFIPNGSYLNHLYQQQSNKAWIEKVIDFTGGMPYNDSLYQTATVSGSGGIHNINAAIGFEVDKNFLAGISLVGRIGNFEYTRKLSEVDVLGKYNVAGSMDMSKFTENNTFNQDYSGFAVSVSGMYLINDYARVTAKIESPTFYEVKETFTRTAEAEFKPNSQGVVFKNKETTLDGEQTYNLSTPFIFSAGASMKIVGVTLTTGVEYIDAAQTNYSSTENSGDFADLNTQISNELRGLVKWGVGFEYPLPITSLIVRGSYEKQTSAYKEVLNRSQSIGLGLGYLIGKKIRVDAMMKISEFNDRFVTYGSNFYSYQTTPTVYGLGITYRFE